jgi:para-aminobenzoate synthetase / 4-amino-4-deoxychorismate lyase
MDSNPGIPGENTAVIRDDATGAWLRFENPVEIVQADRIAEVLPRLRAIEQAVETRRLHAAGWIAYEAAPAFDPALAVRPPGPLPLLWFGLYPAPVPCDLPPAAAPLPNGWQADLPPAAYARAFDRIKQHIRAGDTYQVNFTYRLLHEPFDPDAWQAFLALVHAQRAPFGAYVAAGPWRLCSASPELFFRLDGDRIESRPMKGTAPRGRWSAQDREQAAALAASAKDRAENLMIVDMVRNDLGRIARPGTVETPALCALEPYPTVWQLVSTVTARTAAPVAEIIRALFPPASITGAPKRRTMQIIAELESSPRQAYTGALGFLAPGRRAQFNVAIRTLLLDTRTRRAEYGTGGGIVWDSDSAAEQAECRTKARILSAPPRPPFALLETMLWTPADGVRLLELHLARLRESAAYFGYPCDEPRLRAELAAFTAALPGAPQRLRLRVGPDGAASLQAAPLAAPAAPLVRLALARRPVDPPTFFSTTRPRTAASTKKPRRIFRAMTTCCSATPPAK